MAEERLEWIEASVWSPDRGPRDESGFARVVAEPYGFSIEFPESVLVETGEMLVFQWPFPMDYEGGPDG